MTDRIRALLTLRSLTPTQFADLIQVGRPIVSHILSGRNKASLDVVQRIVAAFPEVALPWLLTGTGPMLTPGVEPKAIIEAQPIPPATPTEPVIIPEAIVKPANPASSLPQTDTVAAQLVTPFKSGQRVGNQQKVVSPPGSDRGSGGLRQPPRKFKSQTSPLQPSRRFEQAAPSVGGGVAMASRAELGAPPETGTSSIGPPIGLSLLPATPSMPKLPQTAEKSRPELPIVTSTTSASPLLSAKAIRRIVIFYQDGSFSDFQPE